VKGEAVEEHPNVERTRKALEAYGRRDFEEMGKYLSDDIVWHVGGYHQLSGDYRGRAAVLEYFKEAQARTGGTLTLETDEILANDRHGAVILRAVGERNGKKLDVRMAEGFRFDDRGRWEEYWAMANDQEAIDDFWK
jgi:uncharacterized protein